VNQVGIFSRIVIGKRFTDQLSILIVVGRCFSENLKREEKQTECAIRYSEIVTGLALESGQENMVETIRNRACHEQRSLKSNRTFKKHLPPDFQSFVINKKLVETSIKYVQ
jgi:hypothetical protein